MAKTTKGLGAGIKYLFSDYEQYEADREKREAELRQRTKERQAGSIDLSRVDFGKEPNIKQAMLDKGLSREDVCKRLAIPYESLVEIEKGESNLPKWCLYLLEDAIKR